MLHFTCDRCHRQLDPKDDLRYVVRIETYAALGTSEFGEDDDDRDHLREIQEVLERIDEDGEISSGDLHQRQRFDLCSDCHNKFMRNPVGNESPLSIDFSPN
ncbi:MAG: hypothetical protein ACI9G1_002404 [Pirellulaceae bacterium]|jgi:hypothetical protein